jgi:microcystin-dependent protein
MFHAGEIIKGRAGRGAFPSGTTMMFVQPAAPVGWTRVTSFDDALLRIVGSAAPGSGGGNGFVATFNAQTATAAHTLTNAEIPLHTHFATATGHRIFDFDTSADHGTAGTNAAGLLQLSSTETNNGSGTSAAPGGGSHTHGITTSIKYVDALIARKS